jgi:hypothetical protein
MLGQCWTLRGVLAVAIGATMGSSAWAGSASDATTKLLKPKLLQQRLLGQPPFAAKHEELCRDVHFSKPVLQAKCNAPLRDQKGKFVGPVGVVSQLDTTPCPAGPIYVGADGALTCTNPFPPAPPFAANYAPLCKNVVFESPMLQAKCNAPLRDAQGKFIGPVGVVSQLDTSACPAGPIYVGVDGALTCTNPLPPSPPFAANYAPLCKNVAFESPVLQAKCNAPLRDAQGKFTGPTGVVSQLDTTACPGGPIYVGLDGTLSCENPFPPAPPFAANYDKLCTAIVFNSPMLQARCNAPLRDAKGKFIGPVGVVSQLDTSACPAGPIYVGLDGHLTCTAPALPLQSEGVPSAKPLSKNSLLKQRITPPE